MNIFVLLKQMPKEEAEDICKETRFLDESDKNVLSAALKLRDQTGGYITAAGCGGCMEKELKEVLTLGIDQAVLLNTPILPMGLTASAEFYAAAIRLFVYDVILCGRQAADGDSAYLAGFLSAGLAIPFVAYAKEICIKEGTFYIRRDTALGEEELGAQGPLLITWAGKLHKSLHPSMAEIQRVYRGEKKPVVLSAGTDFDWNPIEDLEEIERLEPEKKSGLLSWIEGSNEAEKAEKLLELLGRRGFDRKAN